MSVTLALPRGELKEAVQGFGKIINGRSTLPILGCVRFDGDVDGVSAHATDLDQSARYRFGKATGSGGSLVLPLAALKELVKGDAHEQIEMESPDGLAVTVINRVGSHVVKHPLAGMDPQEWPVYPGEVATKPAAGFLETYRRLVPFSSTDESRFVLNAVFVEVADKSEHPVTMVATDGRRLSLWNTMDLPLAHSVIIPTTKFLSWSGLQGDAGVALRTERVKKETRVLGLCLSLGPWFYDVKAVDGTYPNYRQVVPPKEDLSNRITFTEEDTQALKRILPTFPGAGTGAGIELRPGAALPAENGRCAGLTLAGWAEGNAETTLELTGGSRFEGPMPGIGVNGIFLLDALEAGFRVFATHDEMSPLRADDGRGGIHVLMPMRLGTTARTEQPKPEEQAAPEPTRGQEVTNPGEQPKAPGDAAGKNENKPPAADATVSDNTKKEGEEKMAKEPTANGQETELSATDRAVASCETAKTKLREALCALSEAVGTIKDAAKEHKTQAADLEKARATLGKLQAISL